MKRGEIWTASGGPDYAGKPRPVVIIQDNRFAAAQSVTVCPLTTDPVGNEIARLLVTPADASGLREPSRLMADKITTMQRSKLGHRIGDLSGSDVTRLNAAIAVFLGLAG